MDGLNKLAQRKVTTYSRVELDFILSIDSYPTDNVGQFLQCFPCVPHNSSTPATEPSKSVHSLSFRFAGSLDLSRLKVTLDGLLYGNGSKSMDSTFFRMKGLLHINGQHQLHILQAVHSVFDIQPSPYLIGSMNDNTQGQNLIIVIGCNLRYDILLDLFAQCSNP